MEIFYILEITYEVTNEKSITDILSCFSEASIYSSGDDYFSSVTLCNIGIIYKPGNKTVKELKRDLFIFIECLRKFDYNVDLVLESNSAITHYIYCRPSMMKYLKPDYLSKYIASVRGMHDEHLRLQLAIHEYCCKIFE